MINTTWKPSDVDIAWSKNLIAIIKPGGIWSTKDGRSVYKLDHANNNLIAIKNNNPELHKRICNSVEIQGPSKLVYSPHKPILSCGARLVLETTAKVVIDNKKVLE
jgi:hypothetical protein